MAVLNRLLQLSNVKLRRAAFGASLSNAMLAFAVACEESLFIHKQVVQTFNEANNCRDESPAEHK